MDENPYEAPQTTEPQAIEPSQMAVAKQAAKRPIGRRIASVLCFIQGTLALTVTIIVFFTDGEWPHVFGFLGASGFWFLMSYVIFTGKPHKSRSKVP